MDYFTKVLSILPIVPLICFPFIFHILLILTLLPKFQPPFIFAKDSLTHSISQPPFLHNSILDDSHKGKDYYESEYPGTHF